MDYWNISQLKPWKKNEEVRTISKSNYKHLKASVKRYGIKDPFIIDSDGIIYDGAHRYKAAENLIAEGVLESDNGKEIASIPVIIERPETEEDKWDIVLRRGENYATFNEYLFNYHEEYKGIDLANTPITFKDPKTYEEFFPTEEKIILDSTDQTKIEKEKKLITCPNCGLEFNH